MSDRGSSSGASARELRARKRNLTRKRTPGGLELLDLPPDVLVHILVQLPAIEDLCQVDQSCRLFCFGTPDFGKHSLVEAALRIRHLAHTGVAVPGTLVREPWWPWGSTKLKLVHDERCRRGARLVPYVPETVVNPDMDQRNGVAFFKAGAHKRDRAPVALSNARRSHGAHHPPHTPTRTLALAPFSQNGACYYAAARDDPRPHDARV